MLALALSLPSCSGTGSSGSGCGWVRPIYVSPADQLTEQTARAVLAHDKAWKAICGTPS